MRVVCLSDTHSLHAQVSVPPGDLLLHTGDHCNHGTRGEVRQFNRWLGTLEHAHKVIIAGNHDRPWQHQNRYARLWLNQAQYLQGTSTVVDGLKIWGTPWQPEFPPGNPANWAFNLPRGPQLASIWSTIPEDVEILLTHTPPAGILDPIGQGCQDLLQRLQALPRLRLHVFGHIHCGYGIEQRAGTTFVNASICDEDYRPSRPPLVVDL